MMERSLLIADELKSLPKGNFVIMKTGVHPIKTVFLLFLDWGIYGYSVDIDLSVEIVQSKKPYRVLMDGKKANLTEPDFLGTIF